ncbi:hypothetical protein AGMMS49574_24770 [Bacteroidia bacterium]|nr:hypothetical protein AGMMS49574_24770 [Bacteroidia bacterium]
MQLNYFPINIDFEKYQISTENYTDDRLVELRKQYNSTHSFFRNGDAIYISNKDENENIVIGNIVEKDVFADNEITASLIKHIFFRTFKERFPKYTPVDFYPFRFFSGQTKDDVIYNALPSNFQNKIAYKKLIEVQLRMTNIDKTKRFGFVVNIARNWIFNKSCAELNEENYNLINIEVLHAEILAGLQNILAPNEELVGTIKAINGNTATVETNEGYKDYPLDKLFIRKTKFNIGNYLSFALSQEKSDEILNLIEAKRSEIYNAKKLYNEITSIAKSLFSEKGQPVLFQNKDGFCFTVDESPFTFSENTLALKPPTFIFDAAVTKTHTYPDLGLTSFGPYDSITFDIKTPSVLCLCKGSNRGNFTHFLSSLKDGMPQSRYFKKGLLKKYDLQDIVFDIKEIQNFILNDYLNVISAYDEIKPHLAIIEIPAEFRKHKDADNPYYKIKAKLLSLEIPVQFVTSEKVKRYDEYILNSMVLQIYAKLGGTPWVLPSQRSVDREIIVGIGHTWFRANQYKGAEQNRVVGITTFLSSDGQYLLGDKVKDVPFDSYFQELLRSLKNSIDRLSKEQGWQSGDTIRLIFHIFKPIKDIEFDVITQLIKDIPDYSIKFAFVTISKTHPNLIFDTNQNGIQKFNNLMGEFIPNRATNIFLDSETSLIQMLGVSELKTAKHGMSNPIQIKIRTPQHKYHDKELNDYLFYDLSYITQQIFSFTYLSWRSFLAGEQPATMLYSSLIAKLLSKLKNVPGWDSDKLNYGLKKKKWFL